MPDVRILLVGSSGYGAVHARQIELAPGCALIGTFDLRTHDVSDVRGDVWPDLEEVVDRSDSDLVAVATPTHTHAALVTALLATGRRVLVEKPIVADPGDAHALLAAAEGGWLDVVSQRRFQEGPARLRELLTSQRLGRVSTVNCTGATWREADYFRGWRGSNAHGGGNLLNHGMHAVDLLVWLFGAPVESKGIRTASRYPGVDVAESCVGVVRFAAGVLATIEMTLAAQPGEPLRIEVRGDAAGAVLYDRDLVVSAPDGDPIETVRSCDTAAALSRQYAEVARRIRDGRGPAVGPDAAITALELAWRIERSERL